MEILFVILAVLGGALLVIKTDAVFGFVGEIDWAEEHLGAEGGTRIFIKLIGVLFILGGFLWITGGVQAILKAIFKPLGNAF